MRLLRILKEDDERSTLYVVFAVNFVTIEYVDDGQLIRVEARKERIRQSWTLVWVGWMFEVAAV